MYEKSVSESGTLKLKFNKVIKHQPYETGAMGNCVFADEIRVWCWSRYCWSAVVSPAIDDNSIGSSSRKPFCHNNGYIFTQTVAKLRTYSTFSQENTDDKCDRITCKPGSRWPLAACQMIHIRLADQPDLHQQQPCRSQTATSSTLCVISNCIITRNMCRWICIKFF